MDSYKILQLIVLLVAHDFVCQAAKYARGKPKIS